MSYRTIKRVLGETSLERKCRRLFGLCVFVMIAGSFWWYGSKTDELVYDSNRRAGKLLVGTALTGIHFEEWETREEYKPAAAALVDELRNQEYRWRTITEWAPHQPQDEFEWKLLEQWRIVGLSGPEADVESETPGYSQRHLPQKGQYQYYQPIYAKTDCITCHRVVGGDPNMSEGDLMAIVQVSISDEETVKAQNENRAILLVTAIITVFLAMIALYAIVRYVIVKPLKHLRDVSEEIGQGNVELRADIHTGDEFEELSDSFNRMIRHLTNAQKELRGLNADLDGKVDELAQANMRLYEMNRLKSDFLATVSHELRTPLNSIIGFSDVLESIDSLDDKQKRYVTNIQRSGRMLLEMINDILDLAKVESGKMEIRLSEFDIEQVICAQCDMARPLTERKNIDLEYEVEPGLPHLTQDQGKVQQILSNLLSNAIKFTPEGGRIVILASRTAQGNLKLVVVDTGVGIAEDEQMLVFEKFRQGASAVPSGDAMTREYSGTGLGLSIVKELCRLLGGEVTLESELAKGSTFTIDLPWTLTEVPHGDSTIAGQLEEMTKPHALDYTRPADTSVSTPASSSS